MRAHILDMGLIQVGWDMMAEGQGAPPALWSAEEPHLYYLVLTLRGKDGHVIEAESCQVWRNADVHDCASGVIATGCSQHVLADVSEACKLGKCILRQFTSQGFDGAQFQIWRLHVHFKPSLACLLFSVIIPAQLSKQSCMASRSKNWLPV